MCYCTVFALFYFVFEAEGNFQVQAPGGFNRPLPSSKNPHFQNEAKCTTFLVKMSFICRRMKNHFHIKGWALNLVLIQRPGGTRKWLIWRGNLTEDFLPYEFNWGGGIFGLDYFRNFTAFEGVWGKSMWKETRAQYLNPFPRACQPLPQSLFFFSAAILENEKTLGTS